MATTMLNVYDPERQKTAILQNAYEITETREINQIYHMTFSIPADDEKAQYIQPFHYVRWGDDGELYRIINTELEDNDMPTLQVECEHVISTLVDDLMFGAIQYGGGAVKTSAVITYLLSQQKTKNWVLAECDFDRRFEYLWEQENILNALYSIPKEFTKAYKWVFDTTGYPWKLSLKAIDANIHPEYYIRAKRNLLSSGTAQDFSGICTRIYPLGYGEGVNQLGIKEINGGVPYLQSPAAIVAQYGIKEKVLVDRRFENAEALKEYAQTMLDALQTPSMSRSFDVVDLYPLTNQDIDNADVGKICKMTGDDTIAYITKTTRVWDEPGNLEIELSTKATDVASSVADLADRVRIESVYAQGATQLYQHSKDANATPTKGMVMSLYFPTEMRQINKVLMRLKLGSFRSYSQTTDAGGSTTQTTTAGGSTTQTTTDGGSTTQTTTDGGATTQTTTTGGKTTQTTSDGGATTQTTKDGGATTRTTTDGGATTRTTTDGGKTTRTTTSGGDTQTSTASGGSSNETTSNGGSSTQTSSASIPKTQTSSSSAQTTTTTKNAASTVGTTGLNPVEATTTESGGGQGTTSTSDEGISISASTDIIRGHNTIQTWVGSTENTDTAYGTEHSHIFYYDVGLTDSQFEHSHNINITGGSHSHSFSIPSHTHSVTISSHQHSVTIPAHKHSYTIPAHNHTVTIPAHTHSVSIPNHTHDVKIPNHTHEVKIPNHTHEVTIPNHKHEVTIPDHKHEITIPDHTHKVDIPDHRHSVSIPDHTHKLTIPNHSHKVTIPTHTHKITAGIFESGNATSFSIYVGGTLKATVNAKTYDGDITTWLLNAQNQVPRNSWIDVEIRPNDLAYVQCSVFVQGFVQSRGGGNY